MAISNQTDAGGFVASGNMITNFLDTTVKAGQDSWNKILAAKAAMAELFSSQKTLDNMISALPEGDDKNLMILKRNESRGYFQSTVLPVWQRFSSALGISSATDTIPGQPGSGMGVLPLVPIAFVAGAALIGGALLTMAITANQKERALINDPTFRKYNLSSTQAGSSGSILGEASNLAKWLVIGGLVFGGFYLFKKGGSVLKSLS